MLHACIVTYASDMTLLDTTILPFGLAWDSPGMQMASLDHAMWFHRPFNLNQWHFIDQRPVTVGNGRGLATAKVWDTGGQLVASFTQEALLRLSPEFMAVDHG